MFGALMISRIAIPQCLTCAGILIVKACRRQDVFSATRQSLKHGSGNTASFLTLEIHNFAGPLHIAQRTMGCQCLPRIKFGRFHLLS
jgi:hypothetical protein